MNNQNRNGGNRQNPRPAQPQQQNQQPQLQQQQQPQPLPRTPFHDFSAQYIREKYSFGSEAEVIIRKKFAHLDRAKAFQLSHVESHEHAYGAFCRKHYSKAIEDGMTVRHIIDVGGHMTRTATSERVIHGVRNPATQTVHSMIPLIQGLDDTRHANWKRLLANRGINWNNHTLNFCHNRASDQGLCDCPKNLDSDVRSVDSAYYPGVLSGMETYLAQNIDRGVTGFACFNDYHRAIEVGELEYWTPDREAFVQLSTAGGYYRVTSTVKGNSVPYYHHIVNTGNGICWAHYNAQYDVTIVYERKDELPMTNHRYLLVTMTPIPGRRDNLEYVDDLFVKDLAEPVKKTRKVIEFAGHALKSLYDTFKRTGSFVPTAASAMVNLPVDFLSTIIRYDETKFYEAVKSYLMAQKAKLIRASEEKTSTRVEYLYDWIIENPFTDITVTYDDVKDTYHFFAKTYGLDVNERCIEHKFDGEVRMDVLIDAYSQLLCSADQTVALRTLKAMTMKYNSKYNPHIISTSVHMAHFMAMQQTKSLLKNTTHSLTLEVGQLLKNKWSFRHEAQTFLQKYGQKLLKGFLFIFFYNLVIWAAVRFPSARAQGARDVNIPMPAFDVLLQCLVFTTIITTHYVVTRTVEFTKKYKKLPEMPRWLSSTCVTIPDRLDLLKNRGVTDPKFRFRDADWDITCMDGDNAMEKLGCKHEGKVLAGQIGPALHGVEKRTPTVKHSCNRCIMAAAIRATSNKIEANDADIAEWKEFFLQDALKAKEFIAAEGGITFSIDEWVQHYPEKYRAEVYRTLEQPDLFERNFGGYDSFPKVELQFTTVPHDLKNTSANDVKERQISAPSMHKKIAGGVGTYALEGLFHRNFSWYCGRQNWEQICEQLDKGLLDFEDPVAGCADMSGCDMTLREFVCKAQSDAIEIMIKDNGYVSWDTLLSPDLMLRAYRESQTLKVQVNRGDVSYSTVGRASGDSWTTFSNTWIVASMFRFALYKYGFNPDANGKKIGFKPYLLKCKGDDTISIVERKDRELAQLAIQRYFALRNAFEKYGLGTVVKHVKWCEIEEMDFLSNQFFRTNRGLRMVRIPARVFQSMPWSTNVDDTTRDTERVRGELCYSKGMCLKAWAKGLPIFDKLADKFIELGVKTLNVQNEKEYEYVDKYRVWNQEHDDRDAFLQWLHSMYGVTPEEVEELESIIEELGPYDHVSHPVIEKFFL